MVWIIASTVLMSVAGLIVYVYFMEKGQFDDPEDVKYQMFRDQNNQEHEG